MNFSMSIADVVNVTGGDLLVSESDDAKDVLSLSVSSVKIDSRNASNGDLFVAFDGENIDGHQFVESAGMNGAVAAVVEKTCEPEQTPLIKVGSSLEAVADLAADYRTKLSAKVVAITGSMGKTSTKNMLREILSVSHSVTATEGNYNNELGMPLTILSADPKDTFLVLEMGAKRTGDIDHLMDVAKPDLSVVTCISSAHSESFGGLDDTAEAKSEIYRALGSKATALLNLDCDYASAWIEEISAMAEPPSVVTVSCVDPDADYAVSLQASDIEGIKFFVNDNKNNEAFDGVMPLIGDHMLANAAIATALALELGISSRDVVSGLNRIRAESGRMQLHKIGRDCLLIDDTYNANPSAMKSAIDTAVNLAQQQKKTVCLILADMAELGGASAEQHFDVGRHAASKNIHRLYVAGEYAKNIAAGVVSEDGSGIDLHLFTEQADLIAQLQGESFSNTLFLVKGSRSTKMEFVVQCLKESFPIDLLSEGGE